MSEDPADVLRRNRATALAMAQRGGAQRLLALLTKASTDLERRLTQAEGLKGPGKDSFTYQRLDLALRQVRDVTQAVVAGMRGVLVDQVGDLAEQSSRDLHEYMTAANEKFTGVADQGLRLREVDMLDRATQGARSSLLRRIATSGEDASPPEAKDTHRGKMGVLERYGVETVGAFEEVMRAGVISGATWDEMRTDLVEQSPFLQGKPRHWAERILRTEQMGAQNRAGWESIRAADDDLGDMLKIISCVFDGRTGADSYAVHGQIRRPDEPFETWFGAMMHPPDRPNDRAVVVPHRMSWPLPEYLQPRGDDEVAMRWVAEGRKGAPPPRPLMTTVPLDQIGKEPEAKEPLESAEQTPAPRDWPEGGAVEGPPRATAASFDDGGVTVRMGKKEMDLDDFDPARRELLSKLADADEVAPGRVASGGLLPAFGTPEPMPADYEARVADALRAVAKALGEADVSLAKALATHGEEAAITKGEMLHVVPPPSIDRELAARHVAERTSRDLFAEKDPTRMPVLVRVGGKVYLHEGAEAFVAKDAPWLANVRILDVDKLRPAEHVDAGEWAKRGVEPMTRVAEGKGTQADKMAVRDNMREVLAGHGVVTRDDRSEGRFLVVRNPGMGALDVKEHLGPGVMGSHGWNGDVSVTSAVVKSASEVMANLARDPSHYARMDPMQVQTQCKGLHVLMHEEVHGASSARGEAYAGVGIGMEEAATEIIARKATRELLGLKDEPGKGAFGLSTVELGQRTNQNYVKHARFSQAYDENVDGLLLATADVAGRERVHERVEEAVLKTRRWEGGKQKWETPQQQVRAYVDALGLTPEKAAELHSRLMDDRWGPFR